MLQSPKDLGITASRRVSLCLNVIDGQMNEGLTMTPWACVNLGISKHFFASKAISNLRMVLDLSPVGILDILYACVRITRFFRYREVCSWEDSEWFLSSFVHGIWSHPRLSVFPLFPFVVLFIFIVLMGWLGLLHSAVCINTFLSPLFLHFFFICLLLFHDKDIVNGQRILFCYTFLFLSCYICYFLVN